MYVLSRYLLVTLKIGRNGLVTGDTRLGSVDFVVVTVTVTGEDVVTVVGTNGVCVELVRFTVHDSIAINTRIITCSYLVPMYLLPTRM